MVEETQVDMPALVREIRRARRIRMQEAKRRSGIFEALWGSLLLAAGFLTQTLVPVSPLTSGLVLLAAVLAILAVKARLYWWLYPTSHYSKRQFGTETVAVVMIALCGIVLRMWTDATGIDLQQFWPALTLAGLAMLTALQQPLDKTRLQKPTAWLLLAATIVSAVELPAAHILALTVPVLVGLVWLNDGRKRGAFHERRLP